MSVLSDYFEEQQEKRREIYRKIIEPQLNNPEQVFTEGQIQTMNEVLELKSIYSELHGPFGPAIESEDMAQAKIDRLHHLQAKLKYVL